MDYTKEMEFLHELSSKAGAELMQRFGTNVNIRHKLDNSLVTDADLASEKLIIDTLRREHPTHLILSEEAGLSSTARRPGQSIWIIDPLDGTTNFANSYPFFCVSIARAEFKDDGHLEVQSGAVHDPIRKKTYVASLGKGAWVDRVRMNVCRDRPIQDAFLATGFAYHSGENLRKGIDFFHAVAETCQSIRRDGAAALDLALVAEGVYDGYWESGLGAWDLAAGSLLVTEGVDPQVAKRCGLLHDIGKGIDYRIEGSHAVISGDYADRFGEKRLVCDTVMSHHNDLVLDTPLSFVLKSADTLSGARPGARINLEEGYQERLAAMEEAIKTFSGIQKVAIMNGGREVHIGVNHKRIREEDLQDFTAAIARKIEEDVAFPGQIKVLVTRRFEATAVA